MDSGKISELREVNESVSRSVTSLASAQVLQSEEAVRSFLEDLMEGEAERTQVLTAELTTYLEALYLEATYTSLEPFIPGSPSLSAILSAIWAALKIIWKVIVKIAELVQMLHLVEIHQLLYALWDDYRAMVNGLLNRISDFSKTLGWGVDGFSHLLNATKGVLGIVGGITGRGESWIEAQWINNTQHMLDVAAYDLDRLKNHPGVLLELMFQNIPYQANSDMSSWAGKIGSTLDKAVDSVTDITRQTGEITSELLAIQEGMPAIVAKNIPAGIWESLGNYNTKIYDVILPTLARIDSVIDEVNAVIEKYSEKLSSLADNIAHPGDLLLGVDDLPEYARLQQEALIGSVASRDLDRAATAERESLQGDLDSLEAIDNAIAAGVPEVEFLTLEDPQRAALGGITIEPHETWMIDGYGDLH